MRVLLTEKAIDDLIRIGRFIQRDNPARALTFVAELEERCRSLDSAPQAFPLMPGHEEAGIRRRRHRDYLIFYRLDAATAQIEVLHVLNGAQDYEVILFPGLREQEPDESSG